MMWRRRRTGAGTPVLVPNLVLAQRVIRKMTTAASHFLEDETGEALVGVLEPGINTGGVPTVYVLDTISPDESAQRQMYKFEQGDDLQWDIFYWLTENWDSKRRKRLESFGPNLKSKWDIPLRHLGDWHKHPGFMITPSGGDQMTAMDMMADEEQGFEFLLVVILTVGHESTMASGEGVSNYITIPQPEGGSIRVDFWYIHRDNPYFQPITPSIYPDDQLPGVSPLPWHLTHEDRVDEELDLLERDRLWVSSAILYDTDDTLPLEICFIVARTNAAEVLLVVTPRNFPQDEPKIYRAPFSLMSREDDVYEMFEKLWTQAQRVPDPAGWKWTPDKRLIQYVHAVEDAIGIVRPAKVLVQSDKRPAEPMPVVDKKPDHPIDAAAHPVEDVKIEVDVKPETENKPDEKPENENKSEVTATVTETVPVVSDEKETPDKPDDEVKE